MPRKPRGRPASGIVKIGVEIQLPHDVIGWINEQTYDPRIGKPAVGARSELVERLLRQEMARQRQGEASTEDPNLSLDV